MPVDKCHNPFCRVHGMNGDQSYKTASDAPYNMFQNISGEKMNDAVTGAGKSSFGYYTELKEFMKTLGASTSLSAPDNTDDVFPVEIVGQNSNGDDIVRDMTGKLYILVEL